MEIGDTVHTIYLNSGDRTLLKNDAIIQDSEIIEYLIWLSIILLKIKAFALEN